MLVIRLYYYYCSVFFLYSQFGSYNFRILFYFYYSALIILFSNLSLAHSHLSLSLSPAFSSSVPARLIDHFVFDVIFNHFSSKQQHTQVFLVWFIIILHFKLTVIDLKLMGILRKKKSTVFNSVFSFNRIN